MYFCPCGNYSVQPAWLPSFYAKNNFVRNWAVFIFVLPILLTFKFAYKWAVSKKLVTGFDQILVGVIKIYLFGSYLRFKSLYTFLGIKLYDLPLNL
ncbi:hypothetical protein BU099_13590 [Staphylococcus xylosus]|nr:hypothetical protein BU099_13590 [Staphylococcus xylosus]